MNSDHKPKTRSVLPSLLGIGRLVYTAGLPAERYIPRAACRYKHLAINHACITKMSSPRDIDGPQAHPNLVIHDLLSALLPRRRQFR